MAKAKAKKAPAKRLGLKQVMAELKANGTAQTIKVMRNHGVTDEMFGVSYAFLKKLIKRVKIDHELALALWETGIYDARVFACWTADGERMTRKLLNTWAREVCDHGLAHELVSLAQDTDIAVSVMDKWIERKGEWPLAMGWGIASRLAMQPSRGPAEGGLTEERVGELLERIESSLQDAPNRVRYNMNGALISIGCRPKWKTRALRVAKKVGKVEVDMGKTSCKVSDAAATIEKTTSHYAAKGMSPTEGAGGKRRRHC